MQVSGPMGIQLGALVWKHDAWTLVLYDQKKFIKSLGDTLVLPTVTLPGISIHELLSFLWGQAPGAAAIMRDSLQPTQPGEPSGEDVNISAPESSVQQFSDSGLANKELQMDSLINLEEKKAKLNWAYAVDEKKKSVLIATKGDTELRFGHWKNQKQSGLSAPIVYPAWAEIWVDKQKVMRIEVERYKEQLDWQRNPFEIKIPPGFIEISPEQLQEKSQN